VKGGIYHVTQRAPGKEKLFLEANDYLKFIAILKDCSEAFDLEIFSFSLLPNHLHVLLRIKEENLPKAMKSLFEKYAMYFNNKYQRKGHVFCGVYRASFCEDENYLLTISVYIHLNSYKARLVKSPFNYKWHSLDIYVKDIRSSFIKKDIVLNLLHSELKKARNIYREIIKQGVSLKWTNIIEKADAAKNFCKDFAKWVKEKIFENKSHRYTRSPFIRNFLDIEKRIEKYRGEKRITNPKSKEALRYLIQQLLSRGYTIGEISRRMDVNRVTIYRTLRSNAT